MKADLITISDEFDLTTISNEFNPSKIGILVDEHTEKLCLPLIKNHLSDFIHIIVIKSGEQNKSLDTCVKVWKELVDIQFDRSSLLILLGGGVLGDLGGFCVSTFMRGIRFIHIPTTLLAMVDSAIGGKLGVDFMGYKNMIGTFATAEKIFIQPRFLKTLPKRELLNGLAEVIKYGLIFEPSLLDLIESEDKVDQLPFLKIIEISTNIKTKIVDADPKERGLRKILNFGHTIGHAIESMALKNHKDLRHGEAIAIGMICESYISLKRTLIKNHELERIQQLILNIFGHHPYLVSSFEILIDLMLHDKKNKSHKILMSLLDGLGNCTFNIVVSKEEILSSLNHYKNLNYVN